MNKKNSIPFREQLLSQEKNDTQLQRKFNQEVKKMYTENLKKGQRFAHILVSVLIAFLTLLFWVFAKMFEEMQIEHEMTFIEPLRLASMWLTFLSIGLLLLCLWPAFIGKIGLRIYPKLVRLVSWVIILVILIFSFMVIDLLDSQMGFKLSPSDVVYGFASMILVIVIGVHMLLSVRIDRNNLKNKEKSLELECRLTELEEKLNQKDGPEGLPG